MLHRTSLAALLALVSVSIGGQQQPTPATPSLLIRGATVIVGTGEPPRRNADVFVRDGRVAMIGTQLTERAALTLDAGGLILLPGLIDAHVHLAGMPWEERAAQLKRVLQGGVTSVYDVASDLRNTSDLARPGDAPWNRDHPGDRSGARRR